MIMQDLVTDLILKTNLFMAKKGQDVVVRRDLIKAINAISGEDSLDAIYVNNNDSCNIPDVVVMHLFNKDFNMFLMNPDTSDTCPFGYTIEIHQRAFTEYTAEELASVIIHDVLQNVQSDIAKIRFMKAYNHILSHYNMDDILDVFDDVSNSEVVYMMFAEICIRPFRVPVENSDYVSTDEVLNSMGLGDAYDSYLQKVLPVSNDTVDDRIEREVRNDYRDVKTIIDACLDKVIRPYYTMIRNGIPLVTLDNIFGRNNNVSLGFISRNKAFKKRNYVEPDHKSQAISESYNNPKNEYEIRFQLDKIISEMRYAETEAEREVILFKLLTIRKKLAKTHQDLDNKLKQHPDDSNLHYRMDYVQNFEDEADMLRQKTVDMEIKKKQYGIFCKYPAGYEG